MKNIGIDVKPPQKECNDRNCPFHGTLSVRGQVFDGVVESNKMIKTVVVRRDMYRYSPKYERYVKKSGKYHVHNPECIELKEGDKVKFMECRPMSKTVTFVIVEKL